MFYILSTSSNVPQTLGKRFSSIYSVKNVLNKDNMTKTATKFSNMKPIMLRTHQPYRKAAVLIPICVVDDKVSLLYTLRAPHLRTHKGQVSFPGGMLDDKDKNLVATAVRETNEELGIRHEHIRIWGNGRMIVTRGDVAILPVIGEITTDLDPELLNVNKNEVQDAFSVSLQDLCDAKKIGYTQFRDGYSAPIFLGGPNRIWGLTALITHAFLTALLPPIAYSHRMNYVPAIQTRFGRL